MKKKIAILGLTLLFLVSTTGLPVTYHLCEMMQEKSLSECEMCSSVIEEVKPSCCSEETMEYPVKISSENPVCCQDEFVYNKVEDNFISSKTEINKLVTIDELISFTQVSKILSDNLLSIKYNISESPPTVQQKDLYLYNSILLI